VRTPSDSSTSSSSPTDARRGGWCAAVAACVGVLVAASSATYLARGRITVAALGEPVCYAHFLLTERINAWRSHPQRAGVIRTVLFGDSVTLKPNGEKVLGPALEFTLAGRHVRTDLLEMTYPGLSAFPFYYGVERVLEGRPAVAIVEVNLRTFADDWARDDSLRFPRLAAGLSFRRALAMRALLASQRLSPFDVLAFRVEESTDTLCLTEGVRRLAERAARRLGASMNLSLTLEQRSTRQIIGRFTPHAVNAEMARAWYGRDLSSRPAAAAFRQLLQDLRSAGVVTVFFVAPIDTDHLEELGVAGELAVPERLAALQQAIGAQPSEWLDFHAAVRRSDFRDAVHLKPWAIYQIAFAIAGRIAERLNRVPVHRANEATPPRPNG
jgi:hypothetical protein